MQIPLIENISSFEISIIGLLTYVLGISYTSLLLAILTTIFNPSMHSTYFLLNSFGLYMFGWIAMLFCNLMTFMYYLGYNYTNIVKYFDTLKKLHEMSKIITDNKAENKKNVENLDNIMTFVVFCDNVKMCSNLTLCFVSHYGTIVKDYISNLSGISWIEKILALRSHFNIYAKQMLTTFNYIIYQIYSLDNLEKKKDEYLQCYKYMTDNHDENNTDKTNEVSKINTQIEANLQALNYMNDMVQNFANMAKTSSVLDADIIKPTDRKTRRMLQKGNKKNNNKKTQ